VRPQQSLQSVPKLDRLCPFPRNREAHERHTRVCSAKIDDITASKQVWHVEIKEDGDENALETVSFSTSLSSVHNQTDPSIIHIIKSTVSNRPLNSPTRSKVEQPYKMLSTVIIISIITAVVAIALGATYQFGLLDSVIEVAGVYLFKAKAKAEKKKLQAQGLKEGQDFFEGLFMPSADAVVLFYLDNADVFYPRWAQG
jgi:hypothetical protein